MTSNPRLHLIDVIAHDFDATVDFYKRLGVELGDASGGDDIRHAEAAFADDVGMHVDNEHLAGIYNSSWRAGEQSRVVIGFRVDSREAVDELYADLTGAGHPGVQPPYDAFWGARYAVTADPDGNHVGIMSPSDDAHRSWPPVPAPAP